MQGFVHRREGIGEQYDGTNVEFEDLKIGGKPSKKSKLVQDRSGHGNAPDYARPQERPQIQFAGSNDFMGTDVANLENSSDAELMHPEVLADVRDQKGLPIAAGHNVLADQSTGVLSDESVDEDSSEEEDDDDDADNEGIEEDADNDRTAAHEIEDELSLMKRDLEASRSGTRLVYTKGDSYPSTTSGPPSVYDVAEQHHAQIPRVRSNDRQQMPERGAGHRQLLPQVPASDRPPAHHAQRHPIQRPIAPATGPDPATIKVKHENAADPNSALDSRKQINVSADHPFAEPAGTAPRHPTSMPAPQKPTKQLTTHPAQRAKAQQQVPQRQNRSGGHGPNVAAQKQPTAEPGTRHFESPDVDVETDNHQMQRHSNETAAEDEEPIELDYDTSELYRMNYNDLKGQSFDTDPNARAFEADNLQPNDAMSRKLEAVAKLSSSEQGQFVSSLSVNEWEEAGDWFLDQFGGVLKQLKTLRRKKREVAQGFENEVETRHAAVVKKRKHTDDALDAMRKSGGMVLKGTPKKTKKSKS